MSRRYSVARLPGTRSLGIVADYLNRLPAHVTVLHVEQSFREREPTEILLCDHGYAEPRSRQEATEREIRVVLDSCDPHETKMAKIRQIAVDAMDPASPMRTLTTGEKICDECGGYSGDHDRRCSRRPDHDND